MGVFDDPLALSLLDKDSGEGEERWVTMGRNPAVNPLLESVIGDPTKDEYDFSTAQRGKFFKAGARLVPPVHLEPRGPR
ncbi:hypothetical protein JQ561_28895 [Bradyrhizobium diazoefficiens]|nr:hypothetical protein [Bradyrhizobium diazoefficiens]MBR0930646.1 hypothetical protein [Bradyrhizobium diazoefficiens]